MKPDDATLVGRCLDGDRTAFETLLDRYEKSVFNAAYRMVGNYDDALDVTQNVFSKAFEKLSLYDSRYKFYSWVYRIAINESINLLNRRARFEPVDETAISEARSPEEVAEGSEIGRIVERALQGLKPDQRAVIVLRHFAGCSYRDMGSILDIPEKTVKSRLFTARQALREALAAKGIRSR